MLKLVTINITGDDATDFLQGQLSNDLHELDRVPEIRAAWCNPKGRVIWFGTLQALDNGYGLAAPAETVEDIVRRLTVFRFRAKVDFEIVDDGHTEDAAQRVAAGIPWIGAPQCEQFTPHMLNLDVLGAISLDKGCYTGQEIIARTHYRGATKRRTLRYKSGDPVNVGDKIQADGRDIGEVLNAAGTDLLAVVPLSKATLQLRVGNVELTPGALPYDVGQPTRD